MSYKYELSWEEAREIECKRFVAEVNKIREEREARERKERREARTEFYKEVRKWLGGITKSLKRRTTDPTATS